MARIRWDDSMRYGVAELDELHEDLTAVIGDLADAHLRGADPELLEDMAEELYDLALHVFGVEEERMEEHGYARTAEHKAAHAAILRECAAPLMDYLDGEAELTCALLDDLAARWTAHLAGEDRALAQALAGPPAV
ncbi:MAG: hemerythrin domain-containing protein [Thermodesulfobacteriota bacterium]